MNEIGKLLKYELGVNLLLPAEGLASIFWLCMTINGMLGDGNRSDLASAICVFGAMGLFIVIFFIAIYLILQVINAAIIRISCYRANFISWIFWGISSIINVFAALCVVLLGTGYSFFNMVAIEIVLIILISLRLRMKISKCVRANGYCYYR